MKTMLCLSELPSGSSGGWPCPAWQGGKSEASRCLSDEGPALRPGKRFPRFTDSAGLNFNPVVENFPCILDFHLICPYNAFSDGH